MSANYLSPNYSFETEVTMRKINILQTGGPDVLQLVSTTSPSPGRNEVLVDVEAAGVNYLDVLQRVGHGEVAKPYTPGLEGVGTISEVGPGVSQIKIGARVAWINAIGSYAEQIILPVEQAIRIPSSFGISESMLFQGVTAQYLLAEYRDIRPGDVVLVHSAAGGVGQILVQWLKHLSATVIATASSAQKLETARSLGADHAVNYSQGFLEEVLEITNGRGVDLALDAVGAATFSDSVKALARRGMAVSYGRASGPAADVEVRPLVLKAARVAGATMFEYIRDPQEMQQRATAVIHGIEQGWLRMSSTRNFALEQASAAHRAIESRGTQGKLVLVTGR
jgi:NADPH2:quinone reductase